MTVCVTTVGGTEIVTVVGGGVLVAVTVIIFVTICRDGAKLEEVGLLGSGRGRGVFDVDGADGVGCVGTRTIVDVSRTATLEVTTCVTTTTASDVTAGWEGSTGSALAQIAK